MLNTLRRYNPEKRFVDCKVVKFLMDLIEIKVDLKNGDQLALMG